MALQKVKDSMRTTTALDSTKLSGAVPTAALSNVDLVEGTKGADIASAGTIVIGTDGGYFDITGTTGITAMTVAAGRVFTLQFDGVVTLTHSATLYLSGATNFTTEANDHMTFISVGGNNVRQIGTGLKDGGSPVTASADVVDDTTPQLGGDLDMNARSLNFENTNTVSTDPNFLDDYEEGTWTPVIEDSSHSQGEGQVYNTQYGSYVKIGRLVHISFYTNVNTTGSLSGGLWVGGMPFVGAQQYSPVSNALVNHTSSATGISAGHSISGSIGNGVTYIWLFSTMDVQFTVTNMTSNGNLGMSGTYESTL